MIEVINKRSHYDLESITIEWSDVVSKIANDHQTSTCRVLYDKEEPITLVCHNDYRPGTVQKAFDSVEGYDQMHVYILLERQPIPLAVIVMKMMSYWCNQLEKSLMSLRMNRVFD